MFGISSGFALGETSTSRAGISPWPLLKNSSEPKLTWTWVGMGHRQGRRSRADPRKSKEVGKREREGKVRERTKNCPLLGVKMLSAVFRREVEKRLEKCFGVRKIRAGIPTVLLADPVTLSNLFTPSASLILKWVSNIHLCMVVVSLAGQNVQCVCVVRGGCARIFLPRLEVVCLPCPSGACPFKAVSVEA